MSFKPDTMAATNKIILSNSATWEDWNERCLAQANMYRLLDYIQGKEDLLPKPTKPSMANYPQKRRPAIATRSNSQSVQEAIQEAAQEAAEEVEASATITPTSTTIEFSDLTSDGQKSYNMAWSFYQDDQKAFEKQLDLIAKMKEWITANVSVHFQKTCCKATQSLPQWYTTLKKAAGASKRLEDANARRKYREALNLPKSKDLTAWADRWEQAMTEAKEKKVVATTRVSEWFEDFLTAVKDVDPIWAKAYGITKDPQVDNDSLDFHTVANDLRKMASQSFPAMAKIAKGAFGPSFAGKEYQYGRCEESLEDANEDKTKRKRGHSRPTQGQQNNRLLSSNARMPDKEVEPVASRKRKATTSEYTRRVCRGCGGYHLTQNCFYLFPDKAPEGWTPRPRFQKLTEDNLKEDPTLKAEIQRWTKTKAKDED
jgi:hypothetical protein